MPNLRRLGFLPTRVTSGGTITYGRKRVLTNNTLAIGFGDAVKQAGTGDYTAATAGADEQILIASVAQGCMYTQAGTAMRIEAKMLPAATLYTSTSFEPENASYIWIVDQATIVEFEANVANVALALTDMNLNYPQVLTVPSVATGLSNHELNATGRAITATFPWRVREPVRRPDNDISLVDVKVICMINAGQTEPAVSAGLGS